MPCNPWLVPSSRALVACRLPWLLHHHHHHPRPPPLSPTASATGTSRTSSSPRRARCGSSTMTRCAHHARRGTGHGAGLGRASHVTPQCAQVGQPASSAAGTQDGRQHWCTSPSPALALSQRKAIARRQHQAGTAHMHMQRCSTAAGRHDPGRRPGGLAPWALPGSVQRVCGCVRAALDAPAGAPPPPSPAHTACPARTRTRWALLLEHSTPLPSAPPARAQARVLLPTHPRITRPCPCPPIPRSLRHPPPARPPACGRPSQVFTTAWRKCGIDSMLVPTTQKFMINHLGFFYVLK